MPESQEVLALRHYLFDSHVPHRVTCTTSHSQQTNAGHTSRHVMAGTNGTGLALDAAGPEAGQDSPQLAAVFFALLKVERQLHELIYAGPQVTFNIKSGARVPKYAIDDHHDHVHVSVDLGVLIRWPETPVSNDDEWWPIMPIFKSEEDKERAFIRDLYLRHLLREPESFEAVEWWRLELHSKGGDAVMAAIADSGEASAKRNQFKIHNGITD